ncbi:GNAT family N-acetyltransferase [Ornithinibacillus bavariensis]|uniref:Acetyltransferase YjbC n=1 Tax=Ornithinibacillus bavariensis TaxID=545502 RepID=A0A919X9I5_9BACI|nr:GNAT family N-acetyltransferase [Ornithinibacillus bavariensis]GIO26553.1 putative acetyltransferase YjbC [Ornithinibacillus bavariensis]HAM79481.1 GNAT family N-acetyltransferase [Ornithinibacillus sp.]
MNWYEKLQTYFPVDEMKAKEQLDALLEEKGNIYVKDEGKYHIVMYAEFDTFIFVDFLLVSKESRGTGIGHQIIEKLKAKNKPIILEVEAVDPNSPDTEKRLRFYKREGFNPAKDIQYRFQAFLLNDEVPLDIWYWADHSISEMEIFEWMKMVYSEIHSFQAEKIYGCVPKPTHDVIQYAGNENSLV